MAVDKYGNKTLPGDTTTPNYRLFVNGEVTTSKGELVKLRSPLLIGQCQDIVDKHLGKYAVIYLNLSHIEGDDHNTLMKAIRTRVSKAYENHKYLVHIFGRVSNQGDDTQMYAKLAAKQRLESFTDILTNEHRLNGGEVENSIATLVDMLNIYLEIPIFVLIDEFDAPLRAFLSSDKFSEVEREEFLQFYSDFIRLTLVNEHIEKAIITGIHPLAEEHYKWVSHSITEYTFFDGDLMKFYGMNKTEINSIFTYIHLTRTKIGIANSFYSQCRYQFYNNITDMNNPWAIANYLATLQKTDWMNVTQLENFFGFFISIDYRHFEIQFKTMIKNLGLLVDLQYIENIRLTLDELRVLYRALVAPEDGEKYKQKVFQYYIPKFTHKAIVFLQTNGLASLYMSCPRQTPPGTVRVRFPVQEYYKSLQDAVDFHLYKILQPIINQATPAGYTANPYD